MKVFVDTNVILDYILQREHYVEAKQAIVQELVSKNEMFMSVGGFYTMLFVVDKYFRKYLHQGRVAATDQTRDVMRKVLSVFAVVEHDNASLLRGLDDEKFCDIEDSCQYQLAVKSGCEKLLTFNSADFPDSDDARVKVVSLL